MNPDFERRPWWQASMPELPDRAGRRLPDRADVVVVGGGYTGIAAARRLAQQGARVTLVEANRLGWGASTRNGGIIHPGYKWGPRALVARHGEDLGRALFAETLDAYRLVTGLIRDEAIDCDFRECGYVELAWAPSHIRRLEEAQASLASAGVPSTLVRREDLGAEIGSYAWFGGLAVGGSGVLHPGKWFAGLAMSAAAAGADLHEGVRALRVARTADGRVRVETDRGSIDAGDVVVATNGYTNGVAPSLRRRVIPLGSYIIATEPLPESLANELSPRGRAFFDTKNFLYYWHLSADRRMIFGGRASMFPTSVDRTAAILHRGLLDVHPQLAGYRIDHAWGGKVGFTFDLMPHVGRLGGVAYAMGYCGTGVAMSTYLGTRLAEWIGGGPPPALASLGFPLVPVPYEGRPWFLPLVGEWLRLQDRLAGRSR
jgi:glycine/D-amino acid oxidase-like deaminating enzyme